VVTIPGKGAECDLRHEEHPWLCLHVGKASGRDQVTKYCDGFVAWNLDADVCTRISAIEAEPLIRYIAVTFVVSECPSVEAWEAVQCSDTVPGRTRPRGADSVPRLEEEPRSGCGGGAVMRHHR
jgi:hypothetical protein